MKWNQMRRSAHVVDARQVGTRMRRIRRSGSLGLGGMLIAGLFLIVIKVTSGNSSNQNNVLTSQHAKGTERIKQPIQDQTTGAELDFVRAILGDTEDVWERIFREELKKTYPQPQLILFTREVKSACGFGSTATGPFYCPADKKVYLDHSFFQYIEATAQNHADFARAYAIAHEVGHHVQNVLGIGRKISALKAKAQKRDANALTVKQELHADCLAGVWGHHTKKRGLIDRQDIAAALATASQIGDDYLQQRARGHVAPESFKHGTSQQRMNAFARGIAGGRLRDCPIDLAREE